MEKNAHRCSIEYSYIGELRTTLQLRNSFYSESDYNATSMFKDSTKLMSQDAISYISKVTNDVRVVIINEAHYSPFHRVFTADLLPELYKNGFKYFGVEGISNSKKILNELDSLKYPTIYTGYYIQEPQYGNLLREANRVGYQIFAYEKEPWKQGNRELEQAKNIIAILKMDSTAKILIHCGWGHNREDTMDIKTMAYYLKKIGRINPYTISQASYNEQSDKKYESTIYQKYFPFNTPVIYTLKDSIPLEDDKFDLLVFHPRVEYYNFRPSYLTRNSRYKKVRLHVKLKNPYLVLAFLKDELNKNTLPIPIDVFYVGDIKRKKIFLELPFKGTYTIVLKTKTNVFFKELSYK